MGNGFVAKPEDVVEIDEKLEVRILTLNRRRRHIDVSIKGLREEPEAEEIEQVQAEAAPDADSDSGVVDRFEKMEVLSPMELAFKRAMEAGGGEIVQPKVARRRRQQRARAMQAEIIQRTLDTMRD